MTVHAAKGLEFNIVFISGLEEGLFPHENAAFEAKGLEEERRLMYVAVTRARQRLYLSFAQTRMLHGQTRYNIASQFLDEIPAALLKWLTPKVKASPSRSATTLSSSWSNSTTTAAASFSSSAVSRTASIKTVAESGSFYIGQTVMHTKFGQGVIVSTEGSGQDARVQVNFKHAGQKWLALSVARLTPV